MGSSEHRAAIELRRAELRLPLGLDFTDAELAREDRDEHWVGVRAHQIIACLVVQHLAVHEAKVRQVAVDPAARRQGIGQALMGAVEHDLASRGFRRVVLHARENVVPWYESQGYQVEGEPFEEVTIPHRRMVKRLTP